MLIPFTLLATFVHTGTAMASPYQRWPRQGLEHHCMHTRTRTSPRHRLAEPRWLGNAGTRTHWARTPWPEPTMAPPRSSRLWPVEVNSPPRLASPCQEMRCALEEVERGPKKPPLDHNVTAQPPPGHCCAEPIPHRSGHLVRRGGAVELCHDVADAAKELEGEKAPA